MKVQHRNRIESAAAEAAAFRIRVRGSDRFRARLASGSRSSGLRDSPASRAENCRRWSQSLSLRQSPPGLAARICSIRRRSAACLRSTRRAWRRAATCLRFRLFPRIRACASRSEEHTSELQSRENLVCRLLLEKKKKNINKTLVIIKKKKKKK